MAFDPDAYLANQEPANQAQPSFDPDAYLAENGALSIAQAAPSKLSSALQTARDYSRAALQGTTLGFSDEIGSGVAALAAKGAQMAGLVPGDESLGDIYSGMQSQVDAEQRQFSKENTKTALALELAGSAPLAAFGGSAAAGKTLWQTALKGAGIGSAYGGAYGVGTAKEGERLGSGGKGALAGAIGGAVLPVAAKGLGRVISTKASKNPELQRLLAEDVKPTIGQALGGAAGRTEEKLMSTPIFGDMIKRARNMTAGDFQKAAWNRALKPLGDKMPKGKTGREAVAYAHEALSKKYDDVLNKIGAVTPDKAFYSSVDELNELVGKAKMPAKEMREWEFILNKARGSLDENGVMTSEGFKKLESTLTTAGKKLARQDSVFSNDLSMAVRQLREGLRDMLQRQAGGSADELAKINKGYANFKILETAAGGQGATGGSFTAKQLAAAVRKADSSKNKGRFARGQALMQDLSDAGTDIVSDVVPNSGTVDRLAMGGGALASGVMSPAIPASLVAGGAMYTKPIQNALVKAIARRPEKAAAVANRLAALSQKGGSAPAILANKLSE